MIKQSCDRHYKILAMQESCNCECQVFSETSHLRQTQSHVHLPQFYPKVSNAAMRSWPFLLRYDDTCRRAWTRGRASLPLPGRASNGQQLKGSEGRKLCQIGSQQGLHNNALISWIEMLIPWISTPTAQILKPTSSALLANTPRAHLPMIFGGRSWKTQLEKSQNQ